MNGISKFRWVFELDDRLLASNVHMQHFDVIEDWIHVRKNDNSFIKADKCTFECSSSFVPTNSPSEAPSKRDTTLSPSTFSPTSSPTTKPSKIPSQIPTIYPIAFCQSLRIVCGNGVDSWMEFDDKYGSKYQGADNNSLFYEFEFAPNTKYTGTRYLYICENPKAFLISQTFDRDITQISKFYEVDFITLEEKDRVECQLTCSNSLL